MASKSKKTKKTEAATNRAKRKRMGQSADTDDISYDPQLLCIARNPLFLQAFENKAGTLNGEVDYDEFLACLEILGIDNVDQAKAKRAFKAMDFDDEDGLEF